MTQESGERAARGMSGDEVWQSTCTRGLKPCKCTVAMWFWTSYGAIASSLVKPGWFLPHRAAIGLHQLVDKVLRTKPGSSWPVYEVGFFAITGKGWDPGHRLAETHPPLQWAQGRAGGLTSRWECVKVVFIFLFSVNKKLRRRNEMLVVWGERRKCETVISENGQMNSPGRCGRTGRQPCGSTWDGASCISSETREGGCVFLQPHSAAWVQAWVEG